jgi:hypothetical protein
MGPVLLLAAASLRDLPASALFLSLRALPLLLGTIRSESLWLATLECAQQ